MKTIEQEWQEFVDTIFRGIDISDVQRSEMKNAFYGGAAMMLTQLLELSTAPREAALSHIQSLREESLRFAAGKLGEGGPIITHGRRGRA